MRRLPAALAAALALPAVPAAARPVSWPGGWTVIQELDPQAVSALVHLSPSRHWSLGARLMHMRERERTMAGLQATWLLRRWNMPGAQANLYLAGMAGAGWDAQPAAATGGDARPAGLVEAQADWETRRFMLMGLARLHDDGRDGLSATAMARAGIAPFVRDYGKVHLWLFGQVTHRDRSDDRWEPALVGRIFYRTTLFEAGLTDTGGLILNAQLRF
jgi:hypothetical protein